MRRREPQKDKVTFPASCSLSAAELESELSFLMPVLLLFAQSHGVSLGSEHSHTSSLNLEAHF